MATAEADGADAPAFDDGPFGAIDSPVALAGIRKRRMDPEEAKARFQEMRRDLEAARTLADQARAAGAALGAACRAALAPRRCSACVCPGLGLAWPLHAALHAALHGLHPADPCLCLPLTPAHPLTRRRCASARSSSAASCSCTRRSGRRACRVSQPASQRVRQGGGHVQVAACERVHVPGAPQAHAVASAAPCSPAGDALYLLRTPTPLPPPHQT